MEQPPPPDLPEDGTASYLGNRTAATLGPRVTPDAEHTLSVWAVNKESTGEAAPPRPKSEGSSAYRLLNKVAAGGMGEVWEAVQVSLGRVVAIKRVRTDRMMGRPADSLLMLRSFQQEALFAARLEHPNILPVHDLGRDEEGAPLLAMKYVQGTPWDKALVMDFATFSPLSLLGMHLPILIDVMQAVAFAHSKGIVHRDLKPAQVMLGQFGEVLLMDWGLAMFIGSEEERARARELGLPELDDATSASSPSGTPALMAPEQTFVSAQSIGPWTDVYLLGGTLYYLLTGTYPHQDVSAQRAFSKAQKGDVQPPSIRAPKRAIPRELEGLCMRALSRIPEERPGTTEFIAALKDFISGDSRRRESIALTDEIRRELENRVRDYATFASCAAKLDRAAALWPENEALLELREKAYRGYALVAVENKDLVLARLQAERITTPATRETIMGVVAREEQAALRRVQTRRIAIASTIGMLALVIVGGSIFAAKVARERAIAERQRDLATDARKKSDDFAKFVLHDMTEQLSALDRLDLLDPAIERALAYYRSIPLELMEDDDRYAVVQRLMEVTKAAGQRGNRALAEEANESAAKMIDEAPRRLAKTKPWRTSKAGVLGNKANSARRAGNLDEALGFASEAVTIMEALHKELPGDVAVVRDLGHLASLRQQLLFNSSRNQEAFEAAKQVITLLQQNLESIPSDERLESDYTVLADAYQNLIQVAPEVGGIKEGEEAIARLESLIEAMTKEYGDDVDIFDEVADHRLRIGEWFKSRGEAAKAAEQYEEGVESARRVLKEKHARPSVSLKLITLLGVLASVRENLGQSDGALSNLKEARDAGVVLMARDNSNISWIEKHTNTLNQMGILLQNMGKAEEAWNVVSEHFEVLDRALQLAPDYQGLVRSWSVIQLRKASILLSLGKTEEALEWATKGVAVAREGSACYPESRMMRQDIAIARGWQAGILSQMGRGEEALEVQKTMVSDAEEMWALDPGSLVNGDLVASSYANLGFQYRQLGRSSEAEKSISKSVEVRRAMLQRDPANVSTALVLARSLTTLGEVERAIGQDSLAETVFLETVELAEFASQADMNSIDAPQLLTSSAFPLATSFAQQGWDVEAYSLIERGTLGLDMLRARAPRSRLYQVRLGLDLKALSLVFLGRSEDSLKTLEEADQLKDAPWQSPWQAGILSAQILDHSARALVDQGKVSRAIDLSTSATASLESLQASVPSMKMIRAEIATARTGLGRAILAGGDWARAKAALLEAEKAWQEELDADPASVRARNGLAGTRRSLARAIEGMGNIDEALAMLRKTVTERDAKANPGRRDISGVDASYGTMARLLITRNEMGEARQMLDKVRTLQHIDLGNEESSAVYLNSRYWYTEGLWYHANGEPQLAMKAFGYALKGIQVIPPRLATCSDRALQALILYRMGRVDDAKIIVAELEKTEFRDGEIFSLTL